LDRPHVRVLRSCGPPGRGGGAGDDGRLVPVEFRHESLGNRGKPGDAEGRLMARQQTADTIDISLAEVTRTLTARVPLYRWRRLTYQTALLRSLRRAWQPTDRAVLDVGGGTGIMAQSIKELFALDRVASVDVEDRYLDSLDIETRTYDGRTLP